MLILTRTTGQTLHIGSDIIVSVLAVSGKQVRIGIDAPKHTNIVRTEIMGRSNCKSTKQ